MTLLRSLLLLNLKSSNYLPTIHPLSLFATHFRSYLLLYLKLSSYCQPFLWSTSLSLSPTTSWHNLIFLLLTPPPPSYHPPSFNHQTFLHYSPTHKPQRSFPLWFWLRGHLDWLTGKLTDPPNKSWYIKVGIGNFREINVPHRPTKGLSGQMNLFITFW